MTPLELVAHDIICIVKFNAVGGTATRNEIKRVCEYLTKLKTIPASGPTPRDFGLPEVAQAFGVPLSLVLPKVCVVPPPAPPPVRIALPSAEPPKVWIAPGITVSIPPK